jgi:hypothetical protein
VATTIDFWLPVSCSRFVSNFSPLSEGPPKGKKNADKIECWIRYWNCVADVVAKKHLQCPAKGIQSRFVKCYFATVLISTFFMYFFLRKEDQRNAVDSGM